MLDLLIVGNYCHDTLILPDRTVSTLGGSASYISAALRTIPELGFEVVAKVGSDFLYGDRVAQAPIVAADYPTTHFVNDISRGPRVQTLKTVGAPIRATDLSLHRARVGLVCGVAMEILPETVARMSEQCSLLVCDAQSLLRARQPDGKVVLRPLGETEFAPLVSCFDFIKASEDEAPYLDIESLRSKTRLIITQGPKGCTLVEELSQAPVPVQPAVEVDSTGAGDCFMAGLAYGLIRGLKLEDALELGNRFGALAVQQVGVPDFNEALKGSML